MACISSVSPANETPVRRSLPARSTYTSPGPFTITSSTDGSDRSGSSGPEPGREQQHSPAQGVALRTRQRARLPIDELTHLRLERRAAGFAGPRPLDQPLA